MDAPVPAWPVGGVSVDELIAAISGWVDSPAMTALVGQFGGEPPDGPLGTKLEALLKFSDVWDGRNGRERIDAVYSELPPEVNESVRQASRALGLGGRQQPPEQHYDHVLVLGGGVITGRARALFTAALLAAGVQTTAVSALGSLRSLAFDAGYPEIATEGEAMLAGLTEACPPSGPILRRDGVTTLGHSWWVQSYPSEPRTINVIAAPPSRPDQRANTADTLVGWADLVHRPAPDERLLLVTTDIYVPFQHADAVRTLGLTYRCGIDTVGLDTQTFPGWPLAPSSIGQTLQEVRSAIFALDQLHRHALQCE